MTTVEHASFLHRSRAQGSHARTENPVRTVSVSLSSIGVVTAAISIWGGIIPYLGPSFGYSADGSASWHWSLTHTVLALLPGAVGLLIGLSFMARISDTKVGRRKVSLWTTGLLAIACGAWFVIGPLAWRVLDNVGPYFVAASPLRELANQAGYSLGPGLILGVCGAFALGWATRHNRPLTTTRQVEEVGPPPAAPISTVPPVGADMS